MSDVLVLARHVAGVEEFELLYSNDAAMYNNAIAASDVNGDNSINMDDVISLARYAAGVSNTFD